MISRILVLSGIVISLLAVSHGLLFLPHTSSDHAATLHKLEACGCCDEYARYLRGFGFTVTIRNHDEDFSLGNKFAVPGSLQSCHTTIIGDFIIEGHVPMSVINKLLNQRPSINGISLPGMPSGSPGMGGVKSEPFVIYSFGEKGIEEYVVL